MFSDPKKSIDDLATLLGLSKEALVKLSGRAPRLYHRKEEKKPNGGVRIIEPPYKNLKRIQTVLVREIFNKEPTSNEVFGKPGTSHIRAARQHINQPMVMTLDLKDFFPSVSVLQIRAALIDLGYTKEVINIIARLVTTEKRLPQGAPTSPALARIVVNKSLVRISAAIRARIPEANITQYVDDLAISGPPGIKRFRGLICEIFRQSGLSINLSKTKIMYSSEPQVVLGIKVNNRLDVSDEYKEKVKAEAAKNPINILKVRGMQAYVRKVRQSSPA